MPKVTRDDVARLAGTSTAVVSYVINDGPRPVAGGARADGQAPSPQDGERRARGAPAGRAR
ncbi:LacI family transcriptional regulator, partial [Kitasatospora indigofera]